MNDSMSILLASTILALGGLTLYMFKSPNDVDEDNEYDENSLFGSGGLFNWGSTEKDPVEEDSVEDFEDEDHEYKPRKRGPKTQKNRKPSSSRRRY